MEFGINKRDSLILKRGKVKRNQKFKLETNEVMKNLEQSKDTSTWEF